MTKHLNQESLALIHSYRSKNLNQILNDYRLRNIALIAIVLIVLSLLWWLNKKQQSKQAAVFSLIQSEGLASETVADTETLQSSSLVEQVESLIAQNRGALPDVEDFDVAQQLGNIAVEEISFSKKISQETTHESIESNVTDMPSQIYEQNGYH